MNAIKPHEKRAPSRGSSTHLQEQYKNLSSLSSTLVFLL